MKALIDADILKFEVGYGAETGWKSVTEGREQIPPWDYVENLLNRKIEDIVTASKADDYTLYITEGRSFRYDIAKKAPYKGNRKSDKPYHYYNLTAFMKDCLNTKVAFNIEADDLMCMDQISGDGNTIICSRDKDLRTVPGWSFSWENFRQPSFGPELIDKAGYLKLSTDRKTLTGTGNAFHLAQVLIGDRADNVPGLPGCGPVAAYEMLEGREYEHQLHTVIHAYADCYGVDNYEQELLEQGRLTWLVRRMNEDGSPQMWEIGLNE